MTVTVPAAYDSQDLSISTGLATGQLIKAPSIQVLANNHNFLGGHFIPYVANVFSVAGFVAPATGTNYQNFFVIPVERELNGRGMQFTGYFTNSSTSDLVVRLICGTFGGSDVTIPANTTTPTTFNLTCSQTPTSSGFVASVQAKTGSESNALKCISGSFWWGALTGTQPAPITNAGYVWAQTAQHATHYPLTVEHVNRFLGGPAKLWNTTPQASASMVLDAIVRPFTTTSTAYVNVGFLPVARRGYDKLKMLVIGDNGTVSVDGFALVATGANGSGATTAPSSLSFASTDDFDVSWFQNNYSNNLKIQFKSNNGSTATLYTVILGVGGKS